MLDKQKEEKNSVEYIRYLDDGGITYQGPGSLNLIFYTTTLKYKEDTQNNLEIIKNILRQKYNLKIKSDVEEIIIEKTDQEDRLKYYKNIITNQKICTYTCRILFQIYEFHNLCME